MRKKTTLTEELSKMKGLMVYENGDYKNPIITEQNTKPTIITDKDGKRYEVTTTVAPPYQSDALKVVFNAGKHDIDQNGVNELNKALVGVKQWMKKNPNLTTENIVVSINAGSSNYWGQTPKPASDTKNNLALTQKRANAGRNAIQELSKKVFTDDELNRITFVADGKSGANQGPYWGDIKQKDPNADFKAYQKQVKPYQFVSVTAFAPGDKTTKVGLPEICSRGFQTGGGTRATESNGWKTYMENGGKGRLIEFGKGIGKIKFTFNAKVIPDLFMIEYNGEQYFSEYKGKEGFISNYTDKIIAARRKGGKEIIKKLESADKKATEKLVKSLINIGKMLDKGDSQKTWAALDKRYQTKEGEKTFLEILALANKLSTEETNLFKNDFRNFFKEITTKLTQKNEKGKTIRGDFGSEISGDEAQKWLSVEGNRRKLYNLLKTFNKLYTTERKLNQIFGFFNFGKKNEFKQGVESLNSLKRSMDEPAKQIGKLILKYQDLIKQQTEIDNNSGGAITRDDIDNTQGVNAKLKMYASQLDDLSGTVPKDEVVGPMGSILIDKIEGVDTGYLQVWAPFGGTVWSYSIQCIGADGQKGGMSADVGSEGDEKEDEKREIEKLYDTES